jgi:hypothetical protein
MKVCVYVCVCVRWPAAGPTQAITLKFGIGLLISLGLRTKLGGDPKCWVHPTIRGYLL